MCSKLGSVERIADSLTFPVITDLIRMKASSKSIDGLSNERLSVDSDQHKLTSKLSIKASTSVCDRTPSLGGPTVRQEATCVAAASGPCRRLRGL
jgi:hypothetical protein